MIKLRNILKEIKIEIPIHQYHITYWEDDTRLYKEENFKGSLKAAKKHTLEQLQRQRRWRKGEYSANITPIENGKKQFEKRIQIDMNDKID